MTAREVALQVVRDVFPSSGPQRGAQESLDYRLRAAALDERDRSFATRLAYGAIEMRRALDWQLEPFIGERRKTLPATTHEILRLAIYELCYTDSDAYATLYEFVEIAKRRGHRGLAALANAVLRSFLREARRTPARADFASDDEYLGTLYSLPDWLVRQWRGAFGANRLEEICAGVNGPAQSAIVANRSRVEPEALAVRLGEFGVYARRSPFVAESLVLENTANAAAEAINAGLWWTQSESSALAVEVLLPQPGEDVADACSGRGNKALQIAARLGGDGTLVCIDADERKMETLQARLQAYGLHAATEVADLCHMTSAQRFDRLLLDAPCSGVGVVGRHAEARWRKRSDDGERLAILQSRLLEAAGGMLHEGGAIVYAVCSTDPREGVEVVNAFLARNRFSRGLVPAHLEAFLTGDGDVLVPPGIDRRDGFYIARVERNL
ncbi:MAG: transcription antitermination factor NusB [Candidatus Tyrphobacter sp.]